MNFLKKWASIENIYKTTFCLSLNKKCCCDPSDLTVSSIKRAGKTIRGCVYKLKDKHVHEALLLSLKRGLDVHLILDYHENHDNPFLEELKEHGAHVYLWKPNEKLHAKFAIFDEEHVLTGSFNWTKTELHGNIHKVDLIISLYDSTSVHQFITLFDDMLNILNDKCPCNSSTC